MRILQKERLEQYAELMVRVGLNLEKDQTLVVNAPVACADIVHILERTAFRAGAHDVVLCWNDEAAARIRYEEAPAAVFSEFPDWRRRLYEDYAAQGAAFLSLSARDPEAFRGIEPARLSQAEQAAGQALFSYRARLMNNQNTWCVAGVPTAPWARRVFPSLPPEEAVERLWEAILRTVRVTPGKDVLEVWQQHIDFLHRAAAFMNEHRFVSLHYQNERGTDLVIELPEGHIWAGGSERAATGVDFVANLPTEEVYSLPRRDGVNGTVVATRPLVFQGNLIDQFRLTFRQGRVVDFEAKQGEQTLRELLETDEGSCYLGEVALVPYDSPISQSGVLFYHTLFDENASCHLALGKAYPTCLEGGEQMDSLTLARHGVNDSLLHEDFMVGSPDLSIVGTTHDGQEIPVFVQGNFAF